MFISFIIISIIASILAYIVKNKEANHLISIGYSVFVIAFTFYEYQHLGETQLTYFTPDALGILFMFVLALINIITAFHYRTYAKIRNEEAQPIAVHNTAYILFIAALTGVNLSNHFGMTWAFIEATTLTSAVLIYHDRDKLSLEAVWKYIFVASISIILAFAGILFLSIGSQEINSVELGYADIQEIASHMNPIWMKASFLFILVGFSVKMGIFPMFSVDIDAKDTSPSPVGAMFSSVLLNAGFLAIFRFYIAFSGSSIQPWMNNVLMITGFITVFIAAVYLIRVVNYKRIFAYSSMEHSGLIILALSMGKAGYLAAILHVIFHALVKAGLFYQLGQMYRIYNSKLITKVGGYFFIYPIGGLVMLLGLFSVVGLPPSGLFVTEFLIFKAFITEGHIWLAISVMVLLTLIMFKLSRSVLRLLFISTDNQQDKKLTRKKDISPWEGLSQLILIGITVYLGFVQPPFFMDLVNQAVQIIP